jgi:ubiquinone/menaquinone biosynthesis C-methylase UbiE
MTAQTPCVPNHHAHYPSFAGIGGLLAAASMLGRGDDARLVAKLADLHPGDTVVDIGCGPGSAVRYAAARGVTVTGVDPAPVMLRVARLLTRPGKARYVEGTAERVPLPDATASVVWTIASVHHWDNLEASLRELSRILEPGGRFVAVEKLAQPGATGLGSHGWTESQARAFGSLCAEHGFAEPTIEQHTAGRRTKIAVITRRR